MYHPFRSKITNLHLFRSIHTDSNEAFYKLFYVSCLKINPFDLQHQECYVSHVYFSWIVLYCQCSRFLSCCKSRVLSCLEGKHACGFYVRRNFLKTRNSNLSFSYTEVAIFFECMSLIAIALILLSIFL